MKVPSRNPAFEPIRAQRERFWVELGYTPERAADIVRDEEIRLEAEAGSRLPEVIEAIKQMQGEQDAERKP